jgi:YD repeat-containing protein
LDFGIALLLFFLASVCAAEVILTVHADDVQYSYDSLNRLVEVRYPDKVIRYDYDAAGNRSSLQILDINPTPSLTSLSPNSAIAGAPAFTLRVIGTNFVNGATVQWNNTPRTTTFVSATELRAAISQSDVATAGTASITAVNPDPNNGVSNALPFTITQTCTFSISATSMSFPSGGGSSTVDVTTPTGCNWTAVSNDGFITVDSGSPGLGNGTVNYSVAVNTGPARMGTMTIAAHTFTVTQDSGCAFNLSSTSQNFVAAGGMNSVDVTMATGCTWTAVSNDAFITVNSGTPGSGNGTVNYSVVANTGPARMGTMTIAGITFTVTQDSGCTFTLDRDHQSFAGNGGNGTVNVTASDAACDWTASTTSTFITITSGSSGTGNGTVQYSVDVNAGSTIRNNTITIAGQTFTVYQGINFADVQPNDPFYTEIGKLSARGVTLGCGGGNYCPNDPVTREQMAAFIMRAKGEFNPPMPPSQRFGDVSPENPFYNLIDRLAALGITVGCQANPPLYCPSDPVKREQMAAFLLRALGEFNPPTPPGQRFDDVPAGNPFYNFIDRLAELGITVGCQANPPLYCPTSDVTRAQMAAFLVRAFNL